MYGDPRYLRLLLDWSYGYLVASGSLDSLVVHRSVSGALPWPYPP